MQGRFLSIYWWHPCRVEVFWDLVTTEILKNKQWNASIRSAELSKAVLSAMKLIQYYRMPLQTLAEDRMFWLTGIWIRKTENCEVVFLICCIFSRAVQAERLIWSLWCLYGWMDVCSLVRQFLVRQLSNRKITLTEKSITYSHTQRNFF